MIQEEEEEDEEKTDQVHHILLKMKSRLPRSETRSY